MRITEADAQGPENPEKPADLLSLPSEFYDYIDIFELDYNKSRLDPSTVSNVPLKP